MIIFAENLVDMENAKYPVGIQSFPDLIESGYVYVDKTAFVAKLVKNGKYYFLSRPRRFGKSLFVSTLQAYFEGRRELFRGLEIEKTDIEWTRYPVLHFDFNSENFKSESGLELILDRLLRRHEDKYGRNPLDISLSQRFNTLIFNAFKSTGQKVVVLVDEYDKPLLGIEDNPELFEKNQAILKGFFGNLKSMDSYIRFAFLTGVARFNKVSIFSDLNNLNDISMIEEYSEICGLTEDELQSNFTSGIRTLAERRDEDIETTLKALRDYYDGYLFTPKGRRLYNPFSVLLAFSNREIQPYWFETGTPTFLARRVMERGIDVASLNGVERHRQSLVSVGLESKDVVPLMFQTGYLTIQSYDPDLGRIRLHFPNREVETGFAMNLLPLYAPPVENPDGPFSLFSFQDDLINGLPEQFMERLSTLLKALPYGQHSEASYQSIVYILCLLSSLDAVAEHHSYKGRSDLEVTTKEYVYIFEFKFNGSVDEAMKQIKSRDYAGRYAFDRRKIFLIGANFSDDKSNRGLTGYQIEQVVK